MHKSDIRGAFVTNMGGSKTLEFIMVKLIFAVYSAKRSEKGTKIDRSHGRYFVVSC